MAANILLTKEVINRERQPAYEELDSLWTTCVHARTGRSLKDSDYKNLDLFHRVFESTVEGFEDPMGRLSIAGAQLYWESLVNPFDKITLKDKSDKEEFEKVESWVANVFRNIPKAAEKSDSTTLRSACRLASLAVLSVASR